MPKIEWGNTSKDTQRSAKENDKERKRIKKEADAERKRLLKRGK